MCESAINTHLAGPEEVSHTTRCSLRRYLSSYCINTYSAIIGRFMLVLIEVIRNVRVEGPKRLK